MSFKELDLDERLSQSIADLGYRNLTQIQAEAIPAVQAGHDVLGIAQTGTGKTAAFCLPILDILLANKVKAKSKKPTVLILAPTRELAAQIHDEIAKFSKGTGLRYASITGGVNQRPQEKVLQKGVELLVATPGRLLDLAANHHVDLSEVVHFVLDEADQLLNMGFIRDIRKIVVRLPELRQSLLFSATMPKEVEKLAADILFQPLRLQVTPKVVTVKKVDQHFVAVPAKQKQQALQQLLAQSEVHKAIVFTRTKHGANKVAKKLDKSGFGVEVIHGNKSQNARNRALDNFKSGRAWVMVATDVAARGIDIQEISHVVNFDIPHEAEVYVHRVGRTARAGATGVAWSLVDPEEKSRVRAIERLTKVKPQWLALELDDEIEVPQRVQTEQVSAQDAVPAQNRTNEKNAEGGTGRKRRRRRRGRRRTADKAA
ncbi:MAG: DEAD/DEAH box helicase [Pseudomonadota bacterium]